MQAEPPKLALEPATLLTRISNKNGETPNSELVRNLCYGYAFARTYIPTYKHVCTCTYVRTYVPIRPHRCTQKPHRCTQKPQKRQRLLQCLVQHRCMRAIFHSTKCFASFALRFNPRRMPASFIDNKSNDSALAMASSKFRQGSSQ